MGFRRWLGEVDDLCMFTYGMSIHDLPDMNFYDAYEVGQSPEDFLRENVPDLEALGHLILS
jgi:hypothetical protein